MLKKLDGIQRETIFHAIVHAIRHDYREGFHNTDMGHPVYQPDTSESGYGYADGPDRNALFLALQELSEMDAKADEHFIDDPILTWDDFKQLVSKAHKEIQSRERAA